MRKPFLKALVAIIGLGLPCSTRGASPSAAPELSLSTPPPRNQPTMVYDRARRKVFHVEPARISVAQEPGPPCANPAFAQLIFLEGTWIVQARSRLSASPTDWETAPATSQIEREVRGCILVERYVSTRRGSPYEALRIFAAKAEDRRLQVAVADSAHGPLFVYEGAAEPAGPAFYLPVRNVSGSVLLRLRFTDISADAFVAETQRSLDEGKTWDTTGRADYRRRLRP